jgi:hypothetical protein
VCQHKTRQGVVQAVAPVPKLSGVVLNRTDSGEMYDPIISSSNKFPPSFI